MNKLKDAKELTDDLEFVKDYEYTLGTDLLLAFGAAQYVVISMQPSVELDASHRSIEAGQLAHERYSHLLSSGLPFVRASGMQRVVDTAGNWSLGLCTLIALSTFH